MLALTTQARPRLLIKLTGWPRIGFLKAIFPDAKFIHLVRDGRAVAYSIINVAFWWGWQGPQNWRWGELSPIYQAIWDRHERSFLALAGIEWNLLLDALQTAKQNIPDENFLEVRYEDLCAKPDDLLAEVLTFCDLEHKPDFLPMRRRETLHNANAKWQEELTPRQQALIEDVVQDYLQHYRYL